MEIKHQQALLNDVMRFWVEHYEIPKNAHIHSYDWFWNPLAGRVMFTVLVADGPDPLKPIAEVTNGDLMEEFLTRDEAVWALIDEVSALRQGLGVTHSRDPIEIITDKYWGISSREHIARTREMIAKAKAKAKR